jgi:acetolactate synthase-1/2/3 large subunit
MIAGQVPRRNIGRDVGVLHEVNDQMDAIAGVTKWRRRVLEVAEVAGAVRAAVRQLRTGRPRPVHIEIPPDVLEEEADVTLLPPAEGDRAAAPEPAIARAVEMLVAAQRPVIYAGGGAVLADAHEPLVAIAEHLQAGIATTAEGKGIVHDGSDLSLGAALWPKNPLRRHLDAADVVLVVGSRVALAGFQPGQQVIQIDVDPDEIGRNHGLTFGLVGDARLTLVRLLERLRASAARPSRKAEREALRAELAALDTQEPNSPILRALRAATPDDAIVIAGMTQIGYYSRPFWPVYRPRTYLTSSYSGNLGFEYPTALGAKVACPDRPVIAICGDGGFMYNAQEMSTAVKYGINAVAVVFNDEAFGNVARDLDEAWGGTFSAELRNPDFMKLADAYGVVGLRAERPTDVGDLVRKALSLDRPALVEVRVGRMPRPAFFAPLRSPEKYHR